MLRSARQYPNLAIKYLQSEAYVGFDVSELCRFHLQKSIVLQLTFEDVTDKECRNVAVCPHKAHNVVKSKKPRNVIQKTKRLE
jgi:hypothetical protein